MSRWLITKQRLRPRWIKPSSSCPRMAIGPMGAFDAEALRLLAVSAGAPSRTVTERAGPAALPGQRRQHQRAGGERGADLELAERAQEVAVVLGAGIDHQHACTVVDAENADRTAADVE